jgi:phosphocarrier protein
VNPLGLRASRRAIRASGWAVLCRIQVGRGTRMVDGKSILGLLLLAAARGSTLIIRTDGVDEEAAADALVDFTARGFEDPA